MRRKNKRAKKPVKKPIRKKPVAKKKVSQKKVYATGTYQKRGTSRKSIVFPPGKKSIEKILFTLENYDYGKTFNYLRRRNKPDGKHYKPPQGITVIITILKHGKTWTYARLSPIEFVVNNPNIKGFVIGIMNRLIDDWKAAKEAIEEDSGEDNIDGVPVEYMENLDPRYTIDIAINFMYGKNT